MTDKIPDERIAQFRKMATDDPDKAK